MRDNTEETSSRASEAPKLTYLGMSGLNREWSCNGSVTLVSSYSADRALSIRFYLVSVSSSCRSSVQQVLAAC